MDASDKQPNELLRVQERAAKQEASPDRETGGGGPDCPACHAPVRAGADICEACGKWLLEGKCCFCYAPFREGQKFCGQCGNPPKGITCKTCGTHSYFHFCPKCDTALSKKAAPAVEALKNSPEFQHMLQMRQQLQSAASRTPQSPVTNLRDKLQQELDDYRRHSGSDTPPDEGAPGFHFSGSDKDFSQQMKNSEASRQKLSQQENVDDNAELLRQVKAMQEKVFSDNQAARLYYMSIKLTLPQIKPCSDYLGWKCVYANFIHYNGPAGCACPEQGGHWVCRDDVEWSGPDSYYYEGLYYTPGTET